MDWKKEIKLGDIVGRKSDGDATEAELPFDEPAAERTVTATAVSEPVAEPADVVGEPVVAETVVAETTVAVPAVTAPVVTEPVAGEGVAEVADEASAEGRKSIWKRDLGSRKQKDDASETPGRRQL